MNEIDQILFSNREDFRKWLRKNHNSNKGIWLVFSKNKTLKTVPAREALEEALCFGWIDGLIKSLDEEKYIKKFTPRTWDSKWSELNKTLAARMMECGKMTGPGLAAIERAKKNGRWDAPAREPVPDDKVEILIKDLQAADLALANFLKMPPSAKKAYTGFYLDTKKEETRIRRLQYIIERLNANKKLL
jgi:uncharacterized protein YdeI (YjbR/CyaY-like superfamily)